MTKDQIYQNTPNSCGKPKNGKIHGLAMGETTGKVLELYLIYKWKYKHPLTSGAHTHFTTDDFYPINSLVIIS